MKSKIPTGDELTMAQILADLYTADAAMVRASAESGRLTKYLKALAGYHLQQAAEKRKRQIPEGTSRRVNSIPETNECRTAVKMQ